MLLEGLEHGNKFFSTNDGSDPTKSGTGETWYKIIGYAESIEEAPFKLYGFAERYATWGG